MKRDRKHIPLRTCVVCGTKTSKTDLLRIVTSPQGFVGVDPSGKLPGRGAYVCGDGRCLRGPLKKGRIEYALRTRLKDDDWMTVGASLKALTTQEPNSEAE